MSHPSNAASLPPPSAEAGTPKYRLMYFDTQGRGEVIRYLFAMAHEPFVDDRVPKTADGTSRPTFTSLQAGLPFGLLPVLQVDGEAGTLLAESRAIERFLARRFGLMGGSDVQQQQVDSVTEAVRDLTQAYSRCRGDAATMADFLSTTLTTFLQQLEALAKRCSTSAGHNTLVGDSVTLADLVVYQIFTTPTPDQPAVSKVVDGFPLIGAVIAHVADQPEIRQWIAARPA